MSKSERQHGLPSQEGANFKLPPYRPRRDSRGKFRTLPNPCPSRRIREYEVLVEIPEPIPLTVREIDALEILLGETVPLLKHSRSGK